MVVMGPEGRYKGCASRTESNMAHKLFPSLAALALAGIVIGCAPAVGDDCETSGECPVGAICDVTAPGGYCTLEGCDSESCPDGSVCVEFNAEESFCLKYCEGDNECRSGYVCRDDVGTAGFCYVSE